MAVMSPNGTKRTWRDVSYWVAIGGKAEVELPPRIAIIGSNYDLPDWLSRAAVAT